MQLTTDRATEQCRVGASGARAGLVATLVAASVLALVGPCLAPAAGAQPAPVAPSPPPPAPPAPTGIPLTGPLLASGSTGGEVALFQFRLLELGFFVNEPLGRYGESTRHAVVAFQKFNGLKRTGKIDFWTRIGLGVSNVRVAPRRAQPGRSIDVDLGRQVMIVQSDHRVDAVFDISTGTRATPTPKGQFTLQRQIKGIRRSRLGVLYSPKYFTGGYAIHGSPSVPASPASHGCVRLTNQAINHIWATNLAPMGTLLTVA
ncbi:MAG TPA: L,D-transpeptidase family protein [Microthrixaceae bacterium]|nr:L,D-transpeptidase family protein [Microthrixaceae bacterium]